MPKLTEVQKAQRAIRAVIDRTRGDQSTTLAEFKVLLRIEARMLDERLVEIGCEPLGAR